MDAKASAPLKRAQLAVEDPADLCTKDTGNIGEFQAKNGILCSSEPHLYEAGAVRKILSGANIPLQAFKKKKYEHRGALRGTPGSAYPQPEPYATELPSSAPGRPKLIEL